MTTHHDGSVSGPRFALIACSVALFGALAGGSCPARGETTPAHHKHHHGSAAASKGTSGAASGGAGKKTHHAHAAKSGGAAHHHAHKAHKGAGTTAHGKTHAAARHAAPAAAAAVAPAPAVPAAPPPPAPEDKGTNTGLPLPRFAAMRADKVYVRRGPGQRYPIDWVYHRRGMPVKIEREFDIWRLVEMADGTKGWVHQATLVGQRTFVIPGEAEPESGPDPKTDPKPDAESPGGAGAGAARHGGDQPGRADARVIGHVGTGQEARAMRGVVLLHAQPDDGSAITAVLEPGTVGNIKECPAGSGWCRVFVKGYSGWLEKRLFWGLLPGEVIQPT
ncbi:SH3 domain-containing protein [Acidomonas methanolica]|uniref:SH3 domain-containing protein n=5 Tax=Acidomonas methanolica TaxID=437 RepID=UPI0010532FE3|nr:SH3 domain-containing protein [Acidomonas methanolica]MBU2654285.1 hypothetical protein [Acidomonas methanolica]